LQHNETRRNVKRGPKKRHLELVDATEAADDPPAETCGGRTKSDGECRKPAGQGTEHPGAGQCRYHDGQVEAGHPCPLTLTELESRLWDGVVAQLTALRLYRTAFWPHIYGLVIALAGLHSARQSAIGAAATVKGDNGTMKKHPSSTVTNQMLAQIRQFSNDLGLNPSALAAMDLEDDPTRKLSRMETLIRGRR
jgi:phage terminase small subunit